MKRRGLISLSLSLTAFESSVQEKWTQQITPDDLCNELYREKEMNRARLSSRQCIIVYIVSRIRKRTLMNPIL